MDTGKYEGCSKTAWRCVGQPYTELVDTMMEINRNGPNSCTPADVELWADAPLLFAEVKRLREVILTLLERYCVLDDGEWKEMIE